MLRAIGKKLVLGATIVLIVAVPVKGRVSDAIVPRIEISTPRPGQAVQGSVPILGSTNIRNFRHSELAFAYQNNPTDTWFILAESDQGVVDETLAIWDTTTITDNLYQLRLTVTTQEQQRHVYVVSGVRVRNYTPIETDTPQPDQQSTQALETTAPTSPSFTSTPLPTNPLTISQGDLGQSALKGAGMVVVLFLLGAMIAVLRQKSG
ncbi:MAG: hypothetical protein Kow0088_01890 [Anaerolineales bacterium]